MSDEKQPTLRETIEKIRKEREADTQETLKETKDLIEKINKL
ncbi:hypothetical protein bcgnr5390_12650 [Bacillus luti]|nr:hypothetical protein BC2903_51330 [Bacillus cereus]